MKTDIFESEFEYVTLGCGALGEVIRKIEKGKAYALKKI
jgi:hypothetical protein